MFCGVIHHCPDISAKRGNVQLCHSRIVDPFSSDVYLGQISLQQWEGTRLHSLLDYIQT